MFRLRKRNGREVDRSLLPTLILLSLNCFLAASTQAQDSADSNTENALQLKLRSSQVDSCLVTEKSESWKPSETAIVICDMWDRHHSVNATKRVGELAPRINAFVSKARSTGVTIIHAPSSCIDAYKDHPARRRAIQAIQAGNVPTGIDSWCDWLSDEEKSAYPIDQSDGGIDDDPAERKKWHEELKAEGRNPDSPWQKQIATIEISDRDFITDNGTENWNIQEQEGIKNVLVVGVHTNMCVLGRPFGLRQTAKGGRNVALVRDLTDTMYNPAMSPNVNHFTGTDLVVRHIERFVCPTVTSDQILGDETVFKFEEDNRKHMVAILAEQEYETKTTIPKFAAQNLGKDFRVSYVLADPNDRNQLIGVEVISTADVLLISARRRAFPQPQLDAIRKHVDSGRPIIAIRTASHAFTLNQRMKLPEGGQQWPEFDKDVLGGNYTGHHGNKLTTLVKLNSKSTEHLLLKGVEIEEVKVAGSLYKTSPLANDATVLMTGRIEGIEKNEPVTWVRKSDQGGRVFYTSLGHPADFEQPFFNQLLTNAVYWATDVKQPDSEDSADEKQENSQQENLKQEQTKTELLPASNIPLKVASDLRLELVFEQPIIANPLYLNFDERGRMWVVEYRQYPWPAGLKLVSRDNVWRNVYDPPFAPPPPHKEGSPFRGKDRISIHEDTNGDGQFDSHKIFLDGLNFATAALKGEGGVFVMNPPYLLFYADKNNDDFPDSQTPEVLLSGFGIEDSHSIANSLRWGPDGWIYATQGSTVSASVLNHSKKKSEKESKPIHSIGQNIWRYHPKLRVYEVFAEGGGNAFGVEFDSRGNVFSGHNGGDTRGFHYVQGGYYLKNFGKHGSLSNPYALTYFPAMRHNKAKRFSHTFEIYGGKQLPKRYHEQMIAISPNMHEVVLSHIARDGSTFKTEDVSKLITTGKGEKAEWFTPVDIQTGPDGAIYIADWFSVQSNHYKNHQGETNPELGRIYRLRNVDFKPAAKFDLNELSNEKLVKHLSNPNRWYRENAIRLIAQRWEHERDPMLEKSLFELVNSNQEFSLSAFWALYQIRGMDSQITKLASSNSNPDIRRWGIRLAGDDVRFRGAAIERLQEMVNVSDSDPLVRSQIAATVRYQQPKFAVETIAKLLVHDDSTDLHIPGLIWWAIENHAQQYELLLSELVVKNSFWTSGIQIDGKSLAECLARRWASEGGNQSFNACAELLRRAPEPQKQQLVRGIANAFEGRQSISITDSLAAELAESDGLYAKVLAIRRHDSQAIQWALSEIEKKNSNNTNDSVSKPKLGQIKTLISVLGEVMTVVDDGSSIEKKLLKRLKSDLNSEVLASLLGSIGRARSEKAASTILSRIPSWPLDTQRLGVMTLASRASWATQLLNAIESGKIEKSIVEQDAIERLKFHASSLKEDSADLKQLVAKHFPSKTDAEVDSVNQRIEVIAEKIISSKNGDPLAGRELFHSQTLSCGKCHLMFGRGGEIGPDLTAYNRSNVRNMLLSILYPSVEIREGYDPWTVLTQDGRLLTGFKVSENEESLSLRESTGQTVLISKDEIEAQKPAKNSVMPDGLLDNLSDQEMRDLFAFLSSTSPPK